MESTFITLEDKLDKKTVDHIQIIEQMNQTVDKTKEKVIKNSDEHVKIIETQERFEKKIEIRRDTVLLDN